MRRILFGGVGLILLLGPTRADTIYDTMSIIHEPYHVYTGNGNAVAGIGIFGALQDLRLVDDFAVPSGLQTIVEVEQASLTFLGTVPADGVRVLLYEDSGGRPQENPFIDYHASPADVAQTTFLDEWGQFIGSDLVVKNLNISLPHPGVWWIDVLPYDTSPTGDWFYWVRSLSQATGFEPYCKDGGEGLGGYGHTTWRSVSQQGYQPGDTAMRIDAVPEPASAVLLALLALLGARRTAAA